MVSVVAVVPWAALFRQYLRDVLPNHFPNAFLGTVRILLLGGVGERRVDSRTLGEVLVTRGLGCPRPWVSGVPVAPGRCTCHGGVLSGGRAAGADRTRALVVDGGVRISVRQGPRSVSTRGRGVFHFRHGVAMSGRDGRG